MTLSDRGNKWCSSLNTFEILTNLLIVRTESDIYFAKASLSDPACNPIFTNHQIDDTRLHLAGKIYVMKFCTRELLNGPAVSFCFLEQKYH